jgi:DHA1 family tetracycline resistance protein-like MFS transporter
MLGRISGGRAAFAFIFTTVALDMLALGVMIPVLPKLIAEFQGGDLARASTTVGVFGFTWALMQFVFQPLLGAASDRFGRRPVVLLSNVGLGLDYVLMSGAPNLGFLFAGRVISGICAASFSTANAYISDITPQEGRAARFGMLGAAFGLGFVIGPAVGGLLGAIDLRAPFWVAAGLSLLNAAYGFFVLPESLPPEKRADRMTWKTANIVGSLKLLNTSSVLRALGISTILYYLAHESLPSIYVLYVDKRYGWDTGMVGLTLALVGIGSAIVSGGVTRPFVKRFGEWPALILGHSCGAICFAIYALAPTGAVFLVGVPFGALWGLGGPAQQALMSREVGQAEQGRLQGALGGLRATTGMVGPLLFSWIFAASLRFETFAGAAYLLAAVLLVASLASAITVRRKA